MVELNKLMFIPGKIFQTVHGQPLVKLTKQGPSFQL